MTQLQCKTINLNLCPKVANAIWNEISGEVLIFSHSSRKLFTTNSTGKFIWELSDGKWTVNEIIDRTAKEYDAEIKDIKEDVIDFFSELNKLGFIIWIKL